MCVCVYVCVCVCVCVCVGWYVLHIVHKFFISLEAFTLTESDKLFIYSSACHVLYISENFPLRRHKVLLFIAVQ
jgi:hypothetical protein